MSTVTEQTTILRRYLREKGGFCHSHCDLDNEGGIDIAAEVAKYRNLKDFSMDCSLPSHAVHGILTSLPDGIETLRIHFGIVTGSYKEIIYGLMDSPLTLSNVKKAGIRHPTADEVFPVLSSKLSSTHTLALAVSGDLTDYVGMFGDGLKVLNLCGATVTYSFIEALSARYPHLEGLGFQFCNLTDEIVRSVIRAFPNLVAMNFSDNESLGDSTIDILVEEGKDRAFSRVTIENLGSLTIDGLKKLLIAFPTIQVLYVKDNFEFIPVDVFDPLTNFRELYSGNKCSTNVETLLNRHRTLTRIIIDHDDSRPIFSQTSDADMKEMGIQMFFTKANVNDDSIRKIFLLPCLDDCYLLRKNYSKDLSESGESEWRRLLSEKNKTNMYHRSGRDVVDLDENGESVW